MTFDEIVLEKFKTKEEKIVLEEGLFPITPFIAFAALKRKAFNSLKKAGAFVEKTKRIPRKAKAKALIGKEKVKAVTGATGKDEEQTVYKLTPEQVKVMAKIYNKYGKKLIKQILRFRRDVLAPYQLIKRIIKKSSRVSSKDVHGMTHEEFKNALESGRKKIETRGTFFERAGGKAEKLGEYGDKMDRLRELKSAFESGEKPSYNIASKVFKIFKASEEDFGGYSREELKRVYEQIRKNKDDIKKELDRLKQIKGKRDLTPADFDVSAELVKKSKKLWSGRGVDLTKHEGFKKAGDFDKALSKYFFSREIWKELTSGEDYNIFRQTYISIIDDILKRTTGKRKDVFEKMVKGKKEIEFNEKEKRIWKLRPYVKEKFSGKLEDYYQAIKDEDFGKEPVRIERSEELKDAEQQIENAIRRFERSLEKIMTVEDLRELKQHRLINNLITVKEMKNPENLFKTKGDVDTEKVSDEPTTKKEDYLSPEDFVRRIREIATMPYDSMAQLNKQKQEAEEMVRKMKNQGEEDVVNEYRNIVKQIRMRRTVSPQEVRGQRYEPTAIIDVDDIEGLAGEMIDTKYTDIGSMKRDKARLDNLITKFKEKNPDAESDLARIDFLLKRIARKFERGV